MNNIFLNHFYFVVDTATYEAIKMSDFIRNTFSVLEERTTHTSDGRSWTGIYLYGKNTYLEIFEEGSKWPINSLGIGMGHERIGGIDDLQKIMSLRLNEEVHVYWTEKEQNERKIKWFKCMWIDFLKSNPDSSLWVMEYAPEYLNAHDTIESTNITRQRHLSRIYDPTKELVDIEAISLSLNTDEYDKYLQFYSILGYEIIMNNNKTLLKGPGLTIEIEKSETYNGLTSFRGSISSMSKRRVINLGKSTLSLDHINQSFEWKR